MRIKTRGALLSVLFGAAAGPWLFAQGQPASRNAAYPITNKEKDPGPRQRPGTPRSLNLSEGLAILGAALDSPHGGNSTSDCSHFVQAIYERAGFPYSYVSSSELYAGVDEFRRIANPQPGDLAVWRGHVGIVVNPAQRSFFSLLSSGRGVEAYDSPYWKQRGSPRFFRYIKGNSGNAPSPPVGTASLEPTGLGIGPRGQSTANQFPAEREESASVVAPSERLLEVQPLVTTIFVPVVNSGKPGRDQVSAALLKVFGDSEQALRGRDLFTLTRSLTVFDQFEVKKVHISGNQGWAEVRIHELASLSTGGAKTDKLSESQRWSLRRRDKSTWDLSLPQNTGYLPQDVAVRLLARELVNLTEGSSDSATTAGQKAQLARLLDSLLKK